MAAAVVLAASCNKEDSAWRKLTPEENMDRVATIVSETVDKASPMYASKAFDAYRYFTHNVAKYASDEVMQFFADYEKDHVTTGTETIEGTAYDITTTVIALGDLKGHFKADEEKKAWVKTEASDLQFEMPYYNGSTLVFTLASVDSDEMLMVDSDSDDDKPHIDYDELNVPKRLKATLKVGKETVAAAKVRVACSISDGGIFCKNDKLVVNSNVTLQDFSVALKNISIAGNQVKGAMTIKKGSELLADAKMNMSLILDDEYEELVVEDTELVEGSINLNNQLAGDLKLAPAKMDELNEQARKTSDEAALKAIVDQATPYFSGSFYLDGHKSNKQGNFTVVAAKDDYSGENYLSAAIEFSEGSVVLLDDVMDYFFSETSMIYHIQMWIQELVFRLNGPTIK